jgi:hypothetical protein
MSQSSHDMFQLTQYTIYHLTASKHSSRVGVSVAMRYIVWTCVIQRGYNQAQGISVTLHFERYLPCSAITVTAEIPS